MLIYCHQVVTTDITGTGWVLNHPQYMGNGLSPLRTNSNQGEMTNTIMDEYEFTCPECGQSIEVNEPIREATLEHGCPVCSCSVTPEHFAPAQ